MNTSIMMCNFFADIQNSFHKSFIQDNNWVMYLKGVGTTLEVTLFACILGIAIGLMVAIIKYYHANTGRLRILDALCNFYTTVVRGTPVALQLLIMYFLILSSVSNKVLVAVICFGINSGAYVSEICRGGLDGVDRGQLEAARSVGLSFPRAMRKIVVPQAFKSSLPALCNELIALLKETSVVSFIGLMDLTNASKVIASTTFEPFFPLIISALIYLIVVMIISKLIRILERRLKRSDIR